jgi:hypothetical protein
MYMNGSDASSHAQKKKSFRKLQKPLRWVHVQMRVDRVEFFGGGGAFQNRFSRTIGVTVTPILPHTQRIWMQTLIRAIPRFHRGFRRLYAGIGPPPNLALIGLENCCPGNGTVGSIPTLSAKPSSLVPASPSWPSDTHHTSLSSFAFVHTVGLTIP